MLAGDSQTLTMSWTKPPSTRLHLSGSPGLRQLRWKELGKIMTVWPRVEERRTDGSGKNPRFSSHRPRRGAVVRNRPDFGSRDQQAWSASSLSGGANIVTSVRRNRRSIEMSLRWREPLTSSQQPKRLWSSGQRLFDEFRWLTRSTTKSTVSSNPAPLHHPVRQFSSFSGESLEIRAVCACSRSPWTRGERLGGESRKNQQSLSGAIWLGPWIIAVNSPAHGTGEPDGPQINFVV